MSLASRREYLATMQERYWAAQTCRERTQIPDEVLQVCGCHRKYAIRVLRQATPPAPTTKRRRKRALRYLEALPVIARVWEALDYPYAEEPPTTGTRPAPVPWKSNWSSIMAARPPTSTRSASGSIRSEAFIPTTSADFVNPHLHWYAEAHNLTVTRSRPYRKNDNAHVEQRNRQLVREIVG